MPPTAPVIDVELLLKPISEQLPCGDSLRWDPVWSELNDLRKTRKDPLDASADKVPEWPKVLATATDLLVTRTKDLLIAGWLTEALVRTHGFVGVRDGLALIRGLVEKYWDGLHPLPDDGDMSVRAAPFAWLTSTDGGARMPAAFREIPLANSQGKHTLNWNYWNQRIISPRGNSEEQSAYDKRSAEAEKHKQAFDTAVEATPVPFYQQLRADITACLQVIDQLAPLVDQRLGEQAPGWGDLRKSLNEIQVFVTDVLKRRGGIVSDTPRTTATDGQSAPASPAAGNGQGPIRTRAEAVAHLDEVAKFFTTMDPQSPVAFLIRRAIRWAGLSLEELLAELVKDETTFRYIGETLGLPPREKEKKK